MADLTPEQVVAMQAELDGYKSLGTVDELKGLKAYTEFGTVDELKALLSDYDALLQEQEFNRTQQKERVPAEGADDEISEIRAGLLKAFPELGRLLTADEEEDERVNAYIETSVDHLNELALKAGIKLENDDDVYYLASLVTSLIQKDPKEYKKYVAGDLKAIDRAFKTIAEKFYGKKIVPETMLEPPPQPAQKRGEGKVPSEETPSSLDAATERAYKRLEAMKEEAV